MEKPLDKLKAVLSNREHQITQQTREAINGEVAHIIDEALLSPEVEAVVIRAGQRAILSLARQYWVLWVAIIVGILVAQSILLAFLLKFILGVIQ